MNTKEEIMSHTLHTTNGLKAHAVALQAAGTAIALAGGVPAKLRSLADQLIRSAGSVPANLAEGHGRFGRDRLHHYRIAYGSAKEVDVHLRILATAGAVDQSKADEAIALIKAGAYDSVSVRPIDDSTSSRFQSLSFSVWSGQAG